MCERCDAFSVWERKLEEGAVPPVLVTEGDPRFDQLRNLVGLMRFVADEIETWGADHDPWDFIGHVSIMAIVGEDMNRLCKSIVDLHPDGSWYDSDTGGAHRAMQMKAVGALQDKLEGLMIFNKVLEGADAVESVRTVNEPRPEGDDIMEFMNALNALAGVFGDDDGQVIEA